MDTASIAYDAVSNKQNEASDEWSSTDIKVSVHPSLPDPSRPNRYNSGFVLRRATLLPELARMICSHVWSPNILEGGRRLKSCFREAHLAVLDFDDGVFTLDGASRLAADRGLACIIAPTKSHQRDKVTTGGEVKPPCDRFRMVMPWHRPLNDLRTYEQNLRRLVRQLGADPSCVDGARYFFPSHDVVLVREGRPLVWEPLPPEVPAHFDRKGLGCHLYQATGRLPAWVQRRLHEGHPVGGRHKAAYHLGAALAELGLPSSEILALVSGSPLAAVGLDDLARAVANGIRRVRGV